jgi:lambda repressor-like predicted transcriptional regulator
MAQFLGYTSHQGIKLIDLARELGVTPQAISQTIHRDKQSCSRRIESAIAEKLELPVVKVFPDRQD